MAQGTRFETEEVGFFSPTMKAADTPLGAGEVGYIVTGLKDVAKLRVGDTLTTQARPATDPLPGYKDVKPMVFAALFPTDSDEYPQFRDALERLRLNDASLSYEPEPRRRSASASAAGSSACCTWRSFASGSSASSTSTCS